MNSPVAEFGPHIRAVIDAADKAGFLGEADIAALVAQTARLIARERDRSVADALDAQAEFYWEASTLLDPARGVAEANGEEGMTAVLDAQIRTMREVSTRLRRRAAQWRGVSPEDQAIHDMAAGTPPKSVAADGMQAAGLPSLASDLGDAYFREHPDLDRKTTSLEFRNGEKGWAVVGHHQVEPAPVAKAPAEDEKTAPEPCCDCCAVGDGQCYCEGPKAKMCKCAPCKKAREDMK